jgi:hypothetical protein
MEIQQIAEQIFNFCKEKYPDLDWNFDFTLAWVISREI